MECKLFCVVITRTISMELIDTLWNVNHYHVIISWGNTTELIDTLWNVNNLYTVA